MIILRSSASEHYLFFYLMLGSISFIFMNTAAPMAWSYKLQYYCKLMKLDMKHLL